jgi:hypothetical protein
VGGLHDYAFYTKQTSGPPRRKLPQVIQPYNQGFACKVFKRVGVLVRHQKDHIFHIFRK